MQITFPLSEFPFTWGIWTSHLIHGSLGPPKSTPQTTSRSVQPFLQGPRLWQIKHLNTDTYRPRYSVCNSRPHLLSSEMQLNNKLCIIVATDGTNQPVTQYQWNQSTNFLNTPHICTGLFRNTVKRTCKMYVLNLGLCPVICCLQLTSLMPPLMPLELPAVGDMSLIYIIHHWQLAPSTPYTLIWCQISHELACIPVERSAMSMPSASTWCILVPAYH